MGRKVYFGEQELSLRLTGLLSFFALKREVRIPYKAIKNVYVDYFKPPRWMLKMPGTAISTLNIYEGTFRYAGVWYFLSFEHKVPLLNLELGGTSKYKYVIFEIEKPQEVLLEIQRRLR
ncbi:hypothetical protein [Dendrosporobacter sp. 1207_IL3150]|uniref:hypothetical protein n=1 Tax=Dendrosporobacter sp. 1207_IL3150 TaxID=3084054 RepID=UPI002FD88567